MASIFPSGLNATEDMPVAGAVAVPPPPFRGGPRSRGCAGSATSHSRTASSRLPLASVCPSGLNATE